MIGLLLLLVLVVSLRLWRRRSSNSKGTDVVAPVASLVSRARTEELDGALAGEVVTLATPSMVKEVDGGLAGEVFALAAPSMVKVETFDETGVTLLRIGSGVVLAPNYVVTNKHVIERASFVKVTHKSRTYPAGLSHMLPDLDLCQLRVESLGASAASLRNARDLGVGERVFAIGAPLGFDLTVSDGLVSGLRSLNGVRMIQTSAPISEGSSGGGLFDSKGKLVGIITCSVQRGQNLNFAIPAVEAAALVRHPISPRAESFEAATVPAHADQAALVLAHLEAGFPSAKFEVHADKDYVIHVTWQGSPSNEHVREYLRSQILRRELPNPEFEFHWN